MLKGLLLLYHSNLWIFYGNREMMPYMFIFLGVMVFIISIEEMMEHKKVGSTLAFLIGAAVIYICVSEIFR
ncbi:TPA: DUF3953 domain-containing protein [Bacillus luti]|nr:DUF3953 domain-containing protein [Bacillus luti]